MIILVIIELPNYKAFSHHIVSTFWQFIKIVKLLLWEPNSKIGEVKFPKGKKRYKGYSKYRESNVPYFTEWIIYSNTTNQANQTILNKKIIKIK